MTLGILMFGSCFLTPIIGRVIDKGTNLVFFLKIALLLLFGCFLTTAFFPVMNLLHYYSLVPILFILIQLSL